MKLYDTLSIWTRIINTWFYLLCKLKWWWSSWYWSLMHMFIVFVNGTRPYLVMSLLWQVGSTLCFGNTSIHRWNVSQMYMYWLEHRTSIDIYTRRVLSLVRNVIFLLTYCIQSTSKNMIRYYLFTFYIRISCLVEYKRASLIICSLFVIIFVVAVNISHIYLFGTNWCISSRIIIKQS